MTIQDGIMKESSLHMLSSIKVALLFIILLTDLSSCGPMCGDPDYAQIEFYNETDASFVIGAFVKSNTLGGVLGVNSKDSFYGDHFYDVENGNYLLFVDWRQAESKYRRPLYFYGERGNFGEVMKHYETDTISIAIATSIYNLWNWAETQNRHYLQDLYSYSLNDLGTENDSFRINYNPSLGCSFNIHFNYPSDFLIVGLYFKSDSLANYLKTNTSDFFSIIGRRWSAQNLICPLGYIKAETFTEFFQKCKTDKVRLLIAKSEEDLISWNNDHKDSNLIYSYSYSINELKNEKIKNVNIEYGLTGDGSQ